MSYKNTFEAILNDINEAKHLVERFKNLESIPSIEMDIALSKFRSIYELLLMLQQEKDVSPEWHHTQEPVATQADYSEKYAQESGLSKEASKKRAGRDTEDAHYKPDKEPVEEEGDLPGQYKESDVKEGSTPGQDKEPVVNQGSMPGQDKETGKSRVHKEETHVRDSAQESRDRKRETHVGQNAYEDTVRKQEFNMEGGTAESFDQEKERDAAKKPAEGSIAGNFDQEEKKDETEKPAGITSQVQDSQNAEKPSGSSSQTQDSQNSREPSGSSSQAQDSQKAGKPSNEAGKPSEQSHGQRKERPTGKEKQEEKKEILADKFQQTEARNESMAKNTRDISQKLQKRPVSDIKKAIGINDKFYFIKELFHGSSKQYELTINDLNDKVSYEHALSYLNENFDWNFDEDPASRFLAIIQRKFPE